MTHSTRAGASSVATLPVAVQPEEAVPEPAASEPAASEPTATQLNEAENRKEALSRGPQDADADAGIEESEPGASVPAEADELDDSTEHGKELTLRFVGTASEYFRIWIVNLALSLATLGVFTAWAKVRKKRYLYAHTLLDGTPFQYCGRPVPILKGRIVALSLATAWFAMTRVAWGVSVGIAIFAALLLPWVVVRTIAFNARYSAYRNMTFRFSANYAGMLSVVARGLLVTAASAGLGYPWFRQRLARYIVSRLSFGGVAGTMRAGWTKFFELYVGIGVVLVGVASVAAMSLGMPDPATQLRLTLVFYAVYFVGFTWLRASLMNLLWNHSRLGPASFRSSLDPFKLLMIYATNIVAITCSAGLLIPWATIRTARYRAENLHVYCDPEDLYEFVGGEHSTAGAAGAELGEMLDLDVSL